MIRKFLRQLTPPMVIPLVNAVRAKRSVGPPSRGYFSGNFCSWAEASAAAGQGWEAAGILEKVRASALKVKRGEIAFERDSAAFTERVVHWPMVACVLLGALHGRNGRFHVLDFGGSLGSTYFQHRAELTEIPGLQWSIVEQHHYVECGRREFENDVLRFFDSIPAAAQRTDIDFAMCSGSLQCVADPYEVLEKIANTDARHLLLDRMPIIDGDRDWITIQHVVNPALYEAKYPHRAFARRRLFDAISGLRYRVLLEFPGYDQIPEWKYAGLFCQRL